MATPPPPPPARGGLSLYANLLEENNSSASISRDLRDDGTAKKVIDPALRFQPIRRPQLKPATTKSKPAFPKVPPPSSSATPAAASAATTTTSSAPSAPAPNPAALGRSTLADWAATEEDEYYLYAGGGEKRQRGGRRNKRKKKNRADLDNNNVRETDWDELYDPARPTNVEEYLRSGERVREVREWRAVLYAHRRRQSRGKSEEEEEEEEGRGSGSDREREKRDDRFAPPQSLTFAPPPMSPPRAAASVPNDATGDDAYARRLALSGMAPPSPPPPSHPAPPQPPTTTTTDRATISRAPVRYSPPPPPPQPDEVDIQDDYDPEVDYSSIPLPPPAPPTTTNTIDPDEQQNRTTRPGQKDFARRLMAKYGWTKGSGLGASASGITSALRVQVEKRRRKPDAEGGGFADPKGGRGRIIAPKTSITATNPHHNNDKGGGKEQGRFGKMSVVVLLEHMLDNMADLESEVEAGLGQEIGEECGERYGRVERIVVDVEGRRVFIKFVEGVSALRAVNALEGRIFNGNSIVARFYDEERFEEGIYYDK